MLNTGKKKHFSTLDVEIMKLSQNMQENKTSQQNLANNHTRTRATRTITV